MNQNGIKYIQNEEIEVFDIQGESAIYDAKRDCVHTLNVTAHLIWTKCKVAVSRAEIVRELVAEFEVGMEQADCDVESTLNRLLEIGALVEVESSSR